MIFENKYMVKFVRFQKVSVISLLGLKKLYFKSDVSKKLVFLTKNYKSNLWVLKHFINDRGYLRYKKLFLFLVLILKRKFALIKIIKKFLYRFDRPFVLSYFGYYLGLISEVDFKNWINSVKGKFIFDLSKEKVKAVTYPIIRKDESFGEDNDSFNLLRNFRVNLLKLKRRDPRFIKTNRTPRTWMIHLRRTYSNFMLTLTDSRGRVIACHTSGSSGIKGRKKYKISQKAIEHIFKKFVPYFVNLKIKKVIVVTYKMRAPGLPVLINSLLSFGLSIVSFNVRIVRAHNGVRKSKGR